MSRGTSGPRQPGGGRQQAGPRFRDRKRHQRTGTGVRRLPADADAVIRNRTRPERPAQTEMTGSGVQTVTVTADESGMRVDRFFEARFPNLSFSHIQRIIRKGEVRVNGKRTQPKARLEPGQAVRIPPLKIHRDAPSADAPQGQKDRAFLQSITLYEDDDVLVLNKPMGLAVQGGSGTTRHVDGMLESLRRADGQKPRLVHRLDRSEEHTSELQSPS